MNVTDLIIENRLLKARVDYLEKELDKVSNLEPLEFTLEQFKRSFLKSSFSMETMPHAGGIYAYLKKSTNELYVGQSVDMNRRLKQHFKRGKVVLSGHDAQFNDESEWTYHVLEYIDRNDKKKLNEREAYWIAMAKIAVSDKTTINKEKSSKMISDLKQGKKIGSRKVTRTHKQKGSVTNSTRGNDVRM